MAFASDLALTFLLLSFIVVTFASTNVKLCSQSFSYFEIASKGFSSILNLYMFGAPFVGSYCVHGSQKPKPE